MADSTYSKKSLNKKNNFIQKLSKKETVSSQETAATIGNMKRHYGDHNYFGILLGKNNIVSKSKIKRVKGISQVLDDKNLSSPLRDLNLMRSLESEVNINQDKITKSIESTKNGSSFNYTPNLNRDGSYG